MTAVALILMLSGCGSDENGAQLSSAGAAGTGTAAVAPTPTPTPAAPSYTYEKAANLKVDRTFTGYDRFSSTGTDGKFTTVEFSSSDTAVTSWGKAESKITFADSADLPDGGVYSFPNISAGTGLRIETTTRLVALELPDKLPDYQYFTFAEYGDSSKYRSFVIGSPTNPAELNGIAKLTYSAMINEEEKKAGAKPASLTVDLAKSVVSGTVPMFDDGDALDMTLTGTIDAAKHIKGTLQSVDGKLTGEYRGRPFGPGGKELALVIVLKEADGTLQQAHLTASLQQ
ncbi:hypothetical protein [Sphingomonas sp. 8AM]|uniref:hypothetical protein n=1 Tax=Sphingomonas sp. 8AM TaxID=2653170 RepID=UPI001357B315|nr:hypothetical protein [Sphingomonas sp. 8AM]